MQRLGQSISAHAWSGDGTKVAICPGNSHIEIWARNGNEFVKEATLKEHDKLVTGIDWASKTNRIVSCGQDRNAYVWKFVNGQWKPTLVILRINRAATRVKWSPNEDKFAVASGSKCVSVCYFEEDHDWWVSKHIKKHTSSVLDIDWHPNNILLATASSDMQCRVVSGFIRGVDKKPGETAFGSRLPFGELLGEYQAMGWVKSVSWSEDGNQLAYVSHDSTLTVIDLTNGAPGEVSVVKFSRLPFEDLCFVKPDTVVGVGHDCYPQEVKRVDGVWQVGRNLDAKEEAPKKQQAGTRAAFQMFQNKVDRGTTANVTTLKTKHQNTITGVRGIPPGTKGNFNQCSTVGLDGKLCVWKL